jgi:dynein heavy chain, axonemal
MHASCWYNMPEHGRGCYIFFHTSTFKDWLLPTRKRQAKTDMEADAAKVDGFRILQCVEWLRDKVEISGLQPVNTNLNDDQRREIVDFLVSETAGRLFIFVDGPGRDLIIQAEVPPFRITEFFYLARRQGEKQLSPDNIDSCISYGRFNRNGQNSLESLLSHMENVFCPSFKQNTSWPEGFKKDFLGDLGKFMSSLTETTNALKGKTVLCVPDYDYDDQKAVLEDKEKSQHLEAVLIHWTRQTKAVVHEQAGQELTEDASPIDEHNFWNGRLDDLTDIQMQLDRPEVQSVVSVLTLMKSSYLAPFHKLSQSIQDSRNEAQENFKFLSVMQDLCKKLNSSEPKDISVLLFPLLNSCRFIWSTSSYFHAPERISGLLRKVSNQILERCKSCIRKAGVFNPNVHLAMSALSDCVSCGESWRSAFFKMDESITFESTSKIGWEVAQSSVFAQVDAFVQRCRELLDVCESRIQFSMNVGSAVPSDASSASHEEAESDPDAAVEVNIGSEASEGTKLSEVIKIKATAREGSIIFGGTRGNQVSKSCNDIQTQFAKLLSNLTSVTYDILDVKISKFHSDYNSLKSGVRDLEVMATNVINNSFDSVSSAQQAANLLEAWFHFAKRDSIHISVAKHVQTHFAFCMAELNSVRKEYDFNRRSPILHTNTPFYGGSAIWARSLKRRVENLMEHFTKVWYCVSSREYNDAYGQATAVLASLDDYIKKMYTDWKTLLEEDLSSNLDRHLITQVMLTNCLEGNFSKKLLLLFDEVRIWEKLLFPVPYQALELVAQHDRLRFMKENVMLVVNDFNLVAKNMDKTEKLLFQEKLQVLQKKTSPGIVRLKWNSRGVVDAFVRDCRKLCNDVYDLLKRFKRNHFMISSKCRFISDIVLVIIEKKRIYEEGQFEAAQVDHCSRCKDMMAKASLAIKDAVSDSSAIFDEDSKEVRKEAEKYVLSVDKMVEDALRQAVKKSLQELSRNINGDSKNEVQPLFKVFVTLEKEVVEFKPNKDEIAHMINAVARDLIMMINVVPNLSEKTAKQYDNLPAGVTPFFARISNDEDILKIMVSIMSGMSSSMDKMQKSLSFWSKYKHLFDVDKDAFIRRYSKANRTLQAFEADYQRYKDLQQEVHGEETVSSVNFVQIDCAPLKQRLIAHCVDWQKRFSALLYKNAKQELGDLQSLMAVNSEAIAKTPVTVEQLAENITLVKKLQEKMPETEVRFEPIGQMFVLLEKFDVQVKETDSQQYDELKEKLEVFKVSVNEASARLVVLKDRMKAHLIQTISDLTKQNADRRYEFLRDTMFDSTPTFSQASTSIANWNAIIADDRIKEQSLKSGIDLFTLEAPVFKEIGQNEFDLSLLESIWSARNEWDTAHADLANTYFKSLKVTEIEELCATFQKRLSKIDKSVRTWKIWIFMKETLETFKKLLPLVRDMSNDAWRPRHWHKIMEVTNVPFNPDSETSTLQVITSQGLPAHIQLFALTTATAVQENMIESSIAEIDTTWNNLNWEISKYKGPYSKVRVSEDVMQKLQEHQGTLGTLKISRYCGPFIEVIETWERSLSGVSEIIDAILQMQRIWLYLENIFSSSEDIQKQLPTETALFDTINMGWCGVTKSISSTASILLSSKVPRLLFDVNSMNESLEKIQKSLDVYLEKKRYAFARFYFINDATLLEILGGARDPMIIQAHMKKMFPGISSLTMEAPSKDGRREITAMLSLSGEIMVFSPSLVTEMLPEIWLLNVEKSMRASVRKGILTTLALMKSMKKDRWIHECSKQTLPLACQISWCNEIEKALASTEKGNGKNGLKAYKKKMILIIQKYADLSQAATVDQESYSRKLRDVIVVELLHRDILDKLIKSSCNSVDDFDWNSRLRIYWDKDGDECIIEQSIHHVCYGYEYIGSAPRMVVTMATERCVTSSISAIRMNCIPSIQGSAFSGKSETIKEASRLMGKMLVSFFCTKELRIDVLSNFFSGICQTGAWCCLDDLNSASTSVLSFAANQMLLILKSVSSKADSIMLEGSKSVKLDFSCGFATTSNSDRQIPAFPESLRSLLRPYSIMSPDCVGIAEVLLTTMAILNAKVLAKKAIFAFTLLDHALPKECSFNGPLNALFSTLKLIKEIQRSVPDLPPDSLLMMAIKQSMLPRLTQQNLQTVYSIFEDIFPGIEDSDQSEQSLSSTLVAEMEEMELSPNEYTVQKALELSDCLSFGKGVLMCGKCNSGKTVARDVLFNVIKNKSVTNGEGVIKQHIINPKSLSTSELYGAFAENSSWTDGVCSSILRQQVADDTVCARWIVFDGQTDNSWLDFLNPVLDDSRCLTMTNGEQIEVKNTTSFVIETDSLIHMSPSSLSRCHMINFDDASMTWSLHFDVWIASKEVEVAAVLIKLAQKCFERLFSFREIEVKCCTNISRISTIRNFCSLWDACLNEESGVDKEDEDWPSMVEKWFMYCAIWSFFTPVDLLNTKRVETVFRELHSQFPARNQVFDVYVDTKKKQWSAWTEKISSSWRPKPGSSFDEMIVPTVGLLQGTFVLSTLTVKQVPVLVFGSKACGKKTLGSNVCCTLDAKWAVLIARFTAETTSKAVQDTVEVSVEKRTKEVCAPFGGKQMVFFVQDVHAPASDKFGSQHALELLRTWMETGFWYNRQRQTVMRVKETHILATARLNEGICRMPARFSSRFFQYMVPSFEDSDLKRIYTSILSHKVVDFDESVKSICDAIVLASIEVLKSVLTEFPAVRQNPHYCFSVSDFANVFCGLCQCSKADIDSKDLFLKLWVHESLRVYSDRFDDADDKKSFQKVLDDRLTASFECSWKQLFSKAAGPFFCHVVKEKSSGERGRSYQEIPVGDNRFHDEAFSALRNLQMKEFKLKNMMLSKDVVENLSKICRVLCTPKQHLVLLGVAGCGRSSTCMLSSHMCNYEWKQGFSMQDLTDAIKSVGLSGKKTVFYADFSSHLDVRVLEAINSIITSGRVPGLLSAEENVIIRDNVRLVARECQCGESNEELMALFWKRVCENMRLVIAMSSKSDVFFNFCRVYSAILSSCVSISFSELAISSMRDFATLMMEESLFSSKDRLSEVLQGVHDVVRKMYFESGLWHHVLELSGPSIYVDFIRNYIVLRQKTEHQQRSKLHFLQSSIKKLDLCAEDVTNLVKICEHQKKVVAQSQRECEDLLVIIVQDRRVVDDQTKRVTSDAEKIQKDEIELQQLTFDAQKELDDALPALQRAEDALNSLNKKDIAEIKAYSKPPELVELVLNAVMCIKKLPHGDWNETKKCISDANFLQSLIVFDKESLNEALMSKLSKFTSLAKFNPEEVGKQSGAAKSLCQWIRAMEMYGKILKVVSPKREKLRSNQEALEKKQQQLHESSSKLVQYQEKLEELKVKYDTAVVRKDDLKSQSDALQSKLEMAKSLVASFTPDKVKWVEAIKRNEDIYANIPGDSVLASTVLSYFGCVPSSRKLEIITSIRSILSKHGFLFRSGSAYLEILASDVDLMNWSSQGLGDNVDSVQMAIILSLTNRTPFILDAAGRASKFVSALNGMQKLKIISSSDTDLSAQLEHSIKVGNPILIENIDRDIPEALVNVLLKNYTISDSGSVMVRILGKDVEVDSRFRLMMSSKCTSPNIREMFLLCCQVVDLGQEDLTQFFISLVLKKERPEVQQGDVDSLTKMMNSTDALEKCENEILDVMTNAESLVEDPASVAKLQEKRKIALEFSESINILTESLSNSNDAKAEYLPIAEKCVLFYSVVRSFSLVDPLYSFSLKQFCDVVSFSIEKSNKAETQQKKLVLIGDNLLTFLTQLIFKSSFEKHKLLFIFQVCTRLLIQMGKIRQSDLELLFYGMPSSDNIDSPEESINLFAVWLDSQKWISIVNLSQHPEFDGLSAGMEQSSETWMHWYQSTEPEKLPLPGEWENKCNDIQRIVLINLFRPDRLVFAINIFIGHHFGTKIAAFPSFDLETSTIYNSTAMPIVLTAAPETYPLTHIRAFASRKGCTDKVSVITLQSHQRDLIAPLFRKATEQGTWLIFENADFCDGFYNEIEKVLVFLQGKKHTSDFRCWIVHSVESVYMPSNLLQNCSKVVLEPPNGLKANLDILYCSFTDSQLDGHKKSGKYKKILFALSYFHCVLIEREKFKPHGSLRRNQFTQSDFETGHSVLISMLDNIDDFSWDSFCTIVSERVYGSRVTNFADQKFISSIASGILVPEVVSSANFRLSSLPTYFVPDDGGLQSYKDYISSLPRIQLPAAIFSQASSETEYYGALSDAFKTGFARSKYSSTSSTTIMTKKSLAAADLGLIVVLTKHLQAIPTSINVHTLHQSKASELSHPLVRVLFQEVDTFNSCCKQLRSDISEILLGLKGQIPCSSEILCLISDLLLDVTPACWSSFYPSSKPASSWIQDISRRQSQLLVWASPAPPVVWWIGGLAHPKAFLAAQAQLGSRSSSVAIEILSWEFSSVSQEEHEIVHGPKEGFYCKGIFLDGAL